MRVFRGGPASPDGTDGSSAPAAALRSVSKTRLALAGLAAAALIVLLLSQLAQGKEVIGWFGNVEGTGNIGGELNNPRDIGVNRAGAGPADQGDIYVADYNNHRIQRFDNEGNWVSAWGLDVAGRNEVQKVTFEEFAASDTFTLGNLPGSCSSSTTDPIIYTGTAASVRENMQEALEAKCGANNIALSSGPANPLVEFKGSFAGTDVPMMTCATESGSGTCSITEELDGGGGTAYGYEVCTVASTCKAGVAAGWDGLNEQQQVNVSAFAGTYTLEFEGETTAPIPENSNGSTVATFLEALPAIGAGNVQGTGSANGIKTITFINELALTDLPLMVGDGTELTGESESVQVTPLTDGAPATIGGNGAMDNPESVAVDNDTGNVYVSDRDNKRVNEYDGVGNFIRSFGWDVDATEAGTEYEVCPAANICQSGEAGEGVGQFGTGSTGESWGIAVSPPDGEAANGTVFVADTTNERVNTFDLDGTSPSSFGSAAQFGSSQPRSIAVDSRGIVYATNSPDFIERYDTENANGEGVGFLAPLTERVQESQTVSFLAVNGGDQFTLTCPSGETTAPITMPAGLNNTQLGQAMEAALTSKCGGDYFTTGPIENRTVYFIGSFEGTNVPQMTCTTVSGKGSCFVSAEIDGVPGALLEGTGATATDGIAVDPDLDEGGPEEDILYVLRDPTGNQNGTTRVLQIGPSNDPGLSAAPTADDAQHADGINFGTTLGFGLDPVSGNLYVSASSNPPGPGVGSGHRVYVVNDPPVEPVAEINSISEIGQKSAKVAATINPKTSSATPNPVPGTARLEYKLTTDSEWTEYGPVLDIPAEDANTNPSIILGGLVPNREYEVRYSITSEWGLVTSGAPETFLTLPAAPQIEGFFATNVQASTADLVGVVNPLGQNTKYRFEYGTSPEYGSVAPVPDGEIAASPNAQKVVTSIEGLEGVPYHFRVIAENATGTTTSADQTFTFYPPDCPNGQLRQQTSSAYLPDCRGYELVSPPRAESTILTFEGPVSPTASNPSRFGFTGLLGLIPGTGEPLGIFGDVYISTRTSTGWVTKYVGIRGSEGAVVGGPPNLGGGPNGNFTSNDLGKLIDWDNGQQGYICCGADGSFAGFLWESEDNEFLGRLPTNIEEIEDEGIKDVTEGGFEGAARPSQDFSHYFFSSNNIPFTEDGQPAGEGVAGSLYDNDLETETVILASRAPSGTHLPIDSGPADEYVDFPHPNAGSKEGISTDGSHVMMATEAPGNLTHLYMRVDGATSYDVSIGQDGLNHPAEYEGMTPDGETVYLTSTEQLTPDDEDESQDVFRWTEKPTPTLTRISKGAGGIGNEDGCGSEWIAGCGAEVVDFRSQGGEFSGSVGFATDNSIAANNGNVYFYSPELLDEGQGTYGQRNLYDLRGGAPQYVATFFDDNEAERIQVSPNDDHAAFLTAQKLTTYDNEGFLEMYHYSPPTGEIICVSCKSDGSAPKADIEASQNGLFMSDDGRTFFSTTDALVEKDVNGLWDTYEFVENRAQLISTGTADRDQGRIGHAGLQGVSADGVDVYFSTLDTMVGQDLNGPFYKFYNARTNGGFPFEPEQAGCAAADECHGPDSEPPLAAPAGTSVALGSGGNVRYNPCAGYAKRAKKLSSRAKSLRRRAKKSSGKGARRMNRRSRNFAKRARKTSRKAKRCRSRRANSSSRGAGR